MNRRRTVVVATSLAVLVGASAQAQDAAKVEKGKQVYDAAMPKCKTCHSIGGAGNVKGPLDGVGAKLKADEIKAWMRTPKEMTEKTKSTRKPYMPAYPKDKLSDEDLEALTAYMLSLKK
jgi:mono/diheme cytochrome c family protein